MIDKRIAVIGLGKLGLPLIASVASRGFNAVGYDADPRKIEDYQNGRYPYETDLEHYLTRHHTQIQFTRRLEDLKGSEIYFVIVPTPSSEDGSFSTRYLEACFQSLGKLLADEEGFPVISIVSTVLPGDCEKLKKQLEEVSGKECGKDFGLCYNPAFIALGNVIHNFLHPDFVLIGESDPKSGGILEKFYKTFHAAKSQIHRMNLVNAEVTKISVNTFVTMKISFANTLARICEKLPGADADIVAKAIGDDTRIGRKYLQGALGYGGPCFPRDNRAFSRVCDRTGTPSFLAKATDAVNQIQLQFLGDLVTRLSQPGQTIGILGLAYKQDTDVIEESQGVGIAGYLAAKGYTVTVFDSAAMDNAREKLGDRVIYAESIEDCLNQSSVVVLTTAAKEFANIALEALQSKTLKVVVDCWKVLKNKKIPETIRYIPIGSYIPSAESITELLV